MYKINAIRGNNDPQKSIFLTNHCTHEQLSTALRMQKKPHKAIIAHNHQQQPKNKYEENRNVNVKNTLNISCKKTFQNSEITPKTAFKRCYSITRKQMGSASGLYANNPHYTQLTSSDYLFLMRNRRASIAASQIESIRLTNSSECKFAFNKLLYSIFKNKETNSTWKGSLRVIANDNAHVTHKETSTKQCRLFAI